MEKINIKDIPLSRRKLQELRNNAEKSLYRLNVLASDCYAFSIPPVGVRFLNGTLSDGKDYVGGWDWVKDLTDESAEYVYMLKDVRDLKEGCFYKV